MKLKFKTLPFKWSKSVSITCCVLTSASSSQQSTADIVCTHSTTASVFVCPSTSLVLSLVTNSYNVVMLLVGLLKSFVSKLSSSME